MSLLRRLPLKYRLPLIHGVLEAIAFTRMGQWPRADRLSPGPLIISGFFNENQGIGRAGRLSAEALEAAGYAVVRHDLRPCFRHILDGKAVLPGRGGVWLIHANAPEAMVALMAHRPDQWRDRYRIGYWAWETPLAPPQWARMVRWLHEVWTPSAYVANALAEALRVEGLDDLCGRLRVMPHPLISAPPQPDPARFGLCPDHCKVLSLFDVNSSPARKNPWASIEAWLTAFPEPTPHAALTLKASSLDTITQTRLAEQIASRPDIRLLSEHLSNEDMDRLMASVDIFLSLHRAEGFGLGLLEAMNAGVVVVATEGTGNDFLTADNGYPVPASPVPLQDPDGPYSALPHNPAQVWAEPDIHAAADSLRRLVSDPVARASKMAAARATPARLNARWSAEALKAYDFNRWLDS
ncbi:glycosyltransferase [Asticcacaulis excentricus]|uniref:Glycosyl transferase group 1 n=1 Tax=Asticcacaulis excentricus (strain ATCC 15261 / DSM 4724 / KCTC 12464 / NCIMB 9791 / VKM B-1370 / CB 48) TaxID=573065 RepID=E8RNY8_ASTEC|nr:glycosyltransferase [Asticcacaulis excentricus]ADU11901.1 glycosyl transferase group 1 [Asticcacaulis excentricus CB 48]